MRLVLVAMLLAGCKAEPVKAAAYCQEGNGPCFTTREACVDDDPVRACHPVERPWLIRWLDRNGHTQEKILSSMQACEPAEEYMKQVGNTFLECVPL